MARHRWEFAMIDRPKNRHYQVPRRFGLRTILIVTALFAVMLSSIELTDVSPKLLIFYSSFMIVVGGAQVVFERTPRLASILAGAVLLACIADTSGITEILVSDRGVRWGMIYEALVDQ